MATAASQTASRCARYSKIDSPESDGDAAVLALGLAGGCVTVTLMAGCLGSSSTATPSSTMAAEAIAILNIGSDLLGMRQTRRWEIDGTAALTVSSTVAGARSGSSSS